MASLSTAPVGAISTISHSGVNRIRSIRVVGGFLDGINLDFSDGLSCVIGARGTGKTTVLELIRFALYLDVDWVSLAVVVAATIVFTLGAVVAYDPARGLVSRRGGPG